MYMSPDLSMVMSSGTNGVLPNTPGSAPATVANNWARVSGPLAGGSGAGAATLAPAHTVPATRTPTATIDSFVLIMIRPWHSGPARTTRLTDPVALVYPP